MDRSNPYEAAFEAYLRDRRIGSIAVDEAHRSILADETVKSLDFLVYGPCGAKLLVDVKGRRYPGGSADAPRLGVVVHARRHRRTGTLDREIWR
jgi:hypothetical protein